MSLKFKFIPLTFLKDEEEIKKQIKNTIILRYLFEQNNSTTTLAKVIEGTQYGYNASALVAGKNKFLRISDITDGKVNWQTVPFCDCDDESTYLLYPNDILIARTGGTTGKSFLITNPPLHSIFAGYLIRIRANATTSPQFLNVFLNSYVYWSQIVSINEGEFRPSANAATLSSLILPDCKLEKQLDAVAISNGEIVDGYSDLFELINKTLDEYEKTKNIIIETQNQESSITFLRQSIIQEAMQGKLTPDWRKQNQKTASALKLLEQIKATKERLLKDKKIKNEKPLPTIENGPFELPSNWTWAILDEVVIFTNGKAHEQLVDANGKYVLINSKFVSTNGDVRKHSNELLCPLNKNDIAIVMSDVPDGRALSRCFLVDREETYTLNQRIGSLTSIDGINPKYLQLVLDRNSYYLSFNDSKKQTNLKKEQILSCPIPLPPIEEQNAIVEKVDLLMTKCTALENEIINSEKYATQLMQAVLKEAFETKIAVCQD